MKRKKKYIPVIIIFVLVTAVAGALAFVLLDDSLNSKEKKKIQILTGPSQGKYHQFIEDLTGRLNTRKKETGKTAEFPWKLRAYSTPGSIFNLELLDQGRADFAIAQADAIAGELAKRGHKFQGVAPLFNEYVFLFRVLPKTEKPRVVEFKDCVIQNINIPDLGSGAYLTAERFLNLSGINQANVPRGGFREALVQAVTGPEPGKTGSYLLAVLNKDDHLMRDMLDGRLDGRENGSPSPVWMTGGKTNRYALSFYKSLNIPAAEGPGEQGYPVEFVSLSPEVISSMHELYGFYEKTKLTLTFSGSTGEETISTLFMKAFLVTRSDENKETVAALLAHLTRDDTFRKTMTTGETTGKEEKKVTSKWPLPIHVGAYDTLSREGVIKKGKQWQFQVWPSLIVVCLIILAIAFLIYPEWLTKKRTSLLIQDQAVMKRLGQFSKLKLVKVVGCLILVGMLFFSAAWFINGIEKTASGIYGYDSPFNNMGTWDTGMWLIIFVIVGTAQSIFPSDPNSQLIMLILNLTVKVVVPVIWGAYFYKMAQKKSRYKKRNFSNHVVFIGWDDNYGPMIKKIVEAKKNFIFVIITNGVTESLEQLELPPKNVSLVYGSPWNEDVLKNANIENAKCVYVIPPPKKEGEAAGENGTGVESCAGLAVFLNKYLETMGCPKQNKSKCPVIYVLDREEKSSLDREEKFKTSLEEQGVELLKHPVEYKTLLRSLFFGNGVYSLLTHWVKQLFKKKPGKKETRPNFYMEEFWDKKSKLKKIGKKWGVPRKNRNTRDSPFKKLLIAQDNTSFIKAYRQVEDTIYEKGDVLMGVGVKCSDNIDQNRTGGNGDEESSDKENGDKEGWYYFSAPKQDKSGKFYRFTNHKEAILFYTNIRGK